MNHEDLKDLEEKTTVSNLLEVLEVFAVQLFRTDCADCRNGDHSPSPFSLPEYGMSNCFILR